MPPLRCRAVLAAACALPALARPALADKIPVAVMWLDAYQATSPWPLAADHALAAAAAVRPLTDEQTKRILIEGGPASRLAARLQDGRERFAGLRDLGAADADLAAAERIAVEELPVADACPRLVEIEDLRLRYAELSRDEPAAAAAARLLGACAAQPTVEQQAALARHAQAGAPQGTAVVVPAAAAAVRVESEPPGATVLVDLKPIGVTPIDLPATRRADAFIDVELAGYHKVHRAAAAAGVLAVALARDDGLGALVDRARAAAAQDPAGPALAELGKRVGAARLLLLRQKAGPPESLLARVVDVASGKLDRPTLEIVVEQGVERGDAGDDQAAQLAAADRLVPFSLPPPPPSPIVSGVPIAVAERNRSAPHPKPAEAEPVPPWRRWYTWVIGGVLLTGIAAFLIADNVGSDQVTVHVQHP